MTRLSFGARRSTGTLLIALVAACGARESPPAGAGDAGPTGTDAQLAADATSPADADDAGETVDTGIPPDLCNPLLQDCAPAELCIVETGGTTCVASSTRAKPLGELCGGGECAAGLACVRLDQDARCAQLCEPTTGNGCTAGVSECLRNLRGTRWGVCETLPATCEPTPAQACPPELSCQPFRRFDGRFDFRCLAVGTLAEGDPCTGPRTCARALACVREASTVLCRRLCTRDQDCTDPLRCAGDVAGGRYCR